MEELYKVMDDLLDVEFQMKSGIDILKELEELYMSGEKEEESEGRKLAVLMRGYMQSMKANLNEIINYIDDVTLQKKNDRSIAGEMPQFYFVFRKEQLIGYLFIIGDTQKYRAFPWLAISNLDELPMRVTKPLMEIQIEAWINIGDEIMADFLRRQLTNYEHGIGHRPENLCR